VAEAVRGSLEPDGDEADVRPIEPSPVAQDVGHQRLTDEGRQELVHDHPLVGSLAAERF
jgi:hypothetical protein